VIGSASAELNPRFKTTYSKETRAAGKKKRGKVDLTVVSGKAILLAVKVKAFRLNQGIAQNLLQLEAIRDQNLWKGFDPGNTLLGVVSTAREWVLVKVVFGMDGKPTVSISKPMELSIKPMEKDKVLDQLRVIRG
jgi:hypothetical protein